MKQFMYLNLTDNVCKNMSILYYILTFIAVEQIFKGQFFKFAFLKDLTNLKKDAVNMKNISNK
jgi:hypothetical protein